jgi:hypothetical protein
VSFLLLLCTFGVCRLFPFFSLSLPSGKECVCHYFGPKEITHSKKDCGSGCAVVVVAQGLGFGELDAPVRIKKRKRKKALA